MSTPPQPSTAYLDALRERTERALEQFKPLTSSHRGSEAHEVHRVSQGVEELGPQLVRLSRSIFEYAEEAFAEHQSVAAIAQALTHHGHEVQVGTHGLDTSLRAEAGPPGVGTIAIIAEYDALPAIGHACGHNVIAATAVGAFLALARHPQALPGRVLLLGTPAEEGNSGKELLAQQGFFDGVDAAIMLHPFGYDVVDHPFLGRRQLRARYHGVAAHASAQPYMGRNALDAVTLNYHAVGQLRQHLPPSDRIHGVIREGGTRPSIVPEVAEVEYYVRSATAPTLKDLSKRLEEIAYGVAQATGTSVELTWDAQPFTLPVRTNEPLARRWAQHQQGRGRNPSAGGVVPAELAASTDFGNVSVRLPGIHPMIAISDPEVALHTREFAAAATSSRADTAVVDGAIGLALTALDWLSDADLRAAVQDDFDHHGGALNVAGYFD